MGYFTCEKCKVNECYDKLCAECLTDELLQKELKDESSQPKEKI